MHSRDRPPRGWVVGTSSGVATTVASPLVRRVRLRTVAVVGQLNGYHDRGSHDRRRGKRTAGDECASAARAALDGRDRVADTRLRHRRRPQRVAQELFDVVHCMTSPRLVDSAAKVSRSLVSPLCVWLLMVPTEQPRTVGGLLLGHVVEIAQHEHGALTRRQAGKRASYASWSANADEPVGDACSGRSRSAAPASGRAAIG